VASEEVAVATEVASEVAAVVTVVASEVAVEVTVVEADSEEIEEVAVAPEEVASA
jgi:hypothetical protein